ncbi:NAD-dependent epimerase/dehydratase family protein [Candidatus Daviesbacteria bacterium]|nr:NAD-dependent epimerase/dehydratase family protein [Candidatus Daviesbacteria bacterium]
MKKVLIIGATGFIGSNITPKLKSSGFEVTLFKGDVRNISDWENNIKGQEIILHLAGVKTETDLDYQINTDGIENLFKAIEITGRLPSKIVFFSSQAVYLGCKAPFKETMEPKPTTVYGKSKFKAEQIAQQKSAKLQIQLVILRLSTVLGEGIRRNTTMSGPLNNWVKLGFKGKKIKVFQDGNQTRDYLGIKDVVSASLISINKIKSGIFNVGGGQKYRLIDLAELVKTTTSNKAVIEIVGGGATSSDPRELISDISRLEKFGWKPKQSLKSAVLGLINLYHTQK